MNSASKRVHKPSVRFDEVWVWVQSNYGLG